MSEDERLDLSAWLPEDMGTRRDRVIPAALSALPHAPSTADVIAHAGLRAAAVLFLVAGAAAIAGPPREPATVQAPSIAAALGVDPAFARWARQSTSPPASEVLMVMQQSAR